MVFVFVFCVVFDILCWWFVVVEFNGNLFCVFGIVLFFLLFILIVFNFVGFVFILDLIIILGFLMLCLVMLRLVKFDVIFLVIVFISFLFVIVGFGELFFGGFLLVVGDVGGVNCFCFSIFVFVVGLFFGLVEMFFLFFCG